RHGARRGDHRPTEVRGNRISRRLDADLHYPRSEVPWGALVREVPRSDCCRRIKDRGLPITLSRLRLAGFKSFADPVVIDVAAGLTGVVGPNGCGKSNVVEALRWAMGETSARSLRGDDMDDVIFAGTEARPSRNFAEVTLTIEKATDEAREPDATVLPLL